MNKIIFIICLFLISILFISCDSKQKNNQNETSSFKNLTVEEVEALWEANPDIIVIDVRTQDEIAETGAIENSINIDFNLFFIIWSGYIR